MSVDTTLIEHMLSALDTPSRELTEWEETFLESVREQFEQRWRLSERQAEILERIYAEKTAWRDDDDYAIYETACGHRFEFNEGTPIENKAQFCQYCGGILRDEAIEGGGL